MRINQLFARTDIPTQVGYAGLRCESATSHPLRPGDKKLNWDIWGGFFQPEGAFAFASTARFEYNR